MLLDTWKVSGTLDYLLDLVDLALAGGVDRVKSRGPGCLGRLDGCRDLARLQPGGDVIGGGLLAVAGEEKKKRPVQPLTSITARGLPLLRVAGQTSLSRIQYSSSFQSAFSSPGLPCG